MNYRKSNHFFLNWSYFIFYVDNNYTAKKWAFKTLSLVKFGMRLAQKVFKVFNEELNFKIIKGYF